MLIRFRYRFSVIFEYFLFQRYCGIVENNLFVIHNLRPGGQFARQVPRFGADVADVRNVPPVAFLHLVEVETSHSAEADKANFYRIHRVVNKVD